MKERFSLPSGVELQFLIIDLFQSSIVPGLVPLANNIES